jgi:hypothetical protein
MQKKRKASVSLPLQVVVKICFWLLMTLAEKINVYGLNPSLTDFRHRWSRTSQHTEVLSALWQCSL